MIKITFFKNGTDILKVEISGHANSAPKGDDLICAGVSAIGVGALNALNALNAGQCEMVMKLGFIKIVVIKDDLDLQSKLQFIYFQLLTIKKTNEKYITLREVQRDDEI